MALSTQEVADAMYAHGQGVPGQEEVQGRRSDQGHDREVRRSRVRQAVVQGRHPHADGLRKVRLHVLRRQLHRGSTRGRPRARRKDRCKPSRRGCRHAIRVPQPSAGEGLGIAFVSGLECAVPSVERMASKRSRQKKKRFGAGGRSGGPGRGSSRRCGRKHVEKKPPCRDACPSGNRVREFVTTIAQAERLGKPPDQAFEEAWYVYTDTSPFPAVCGRVCPAACETQCNRKELEGGRQHQQDRAGHRRLRHRKGPPARRSSPRKRGRRRSPSSAPAPAACRAPTSWPGAATA